MPRPWEKPRGNASPTPDLPVRWWPVIGVGALIIVAAIALLRLGGCADSGRSAARGANLTPDYDLTCLAAFDISGSMDEEEKRAAYRFVSQLVREAVRVKAQVPVWEYAETCAMRGELDVEVRADIAAELENLISATRGTWGTRPGLVLREFERYLGSDKAKSSRVLLLLVSDGEMHDQPEVRELCRKIAALPEVRAVVVGPVHKEHWGSVSDAFADFGQRLVVFGASDRRRALDDVLRLLQQGEDE